MSPLGCILLVASRDGMCCRKADMIRAIICVGLLLVLPAAATAQQHAAVDSTAKQTSAEQLQQSLGKNAKILVIDVRSPQEFSAGHIPGSVNIPIDDLAGKLAEMRVSKDTRIVTMCEHGGRSSRAAIELQKLGYSTSSYCTLDSWKKCGYKIETGDGKPRAATRQ
jgi:rhodanese-related sulfurtransferase